MIIPDFALIPRWTAVWMCDRLLLVANSSSHVAITTVIIPYNHSITTPHHDTGSGAGLHAQ